MANECGHYALRTLTTLSRHQENKLPNLARHDTPLVQVGGPKMQIGGDDFANQSIFIHVGFFIQECLRRVPCCCGWCRVIVDFAFFWHRTTRAPQRT